MMLAKHATISTSNLTKAPIGQVISIDLEGTPIPAVQHSNGSVSVINAKGQEKYFRNTEGAWLALYLAKHGKSASAQALLCLGYSATLYGAAYCQVPAWVAEEYLGENGEPCVGGYDYIYWLHCDSQLITSTDREYVITEFKRLVSDPLMEVLPF